MASQIHRLAEANAELASKSSEPHKDVMAHVLPNGHSPVHGTTQLPGKAESLMTLDAVAGQNCQCYLQDMVANCVRERSVWWHRMLGNGPASDLLCPGCTL